MDDIRSGRPVTLTVTGKISGAPGHLLGFYVNSTGGGTIVLRDGGASGTVISGTMTPGVGWHEFKAESQHATLGFHATIAGTINVTFFARSQDEAPWEIPFVTEFWDGDTGITITGAGVSNWAPIKGTHSFTQGTDAARPAYAGGVITFDGVDNFLSTGAFTLSQPCTVFAVVRKVTDQTPSNVRFWDGDTLNSGVGQDAGDGLFSIEAGTFLSSGVAQGIVLFKALLAVYNGASSLASVNAVGASGAAGAGNMGGITLGCSGNKATEFSNSAFKAFGYANTALTTAQQDQIIRSMTEQYGVT